MSAIGTKRAWTSAPHMSAFGGKANTTILRCTCLLLTQSGHLSRTPSQVSALSRFFAVPEF